MCMCEQFVPGPSSGVLPGSGSGVPTAVSAMVMGCITCQYAWSLALSQVVGRCSLTL
jgi:hypothetical protein